MWLTLVVLIMILPYHLIHLSIFFLLRSDLTPISFSFFFLSFFLELCANYAKFISAFHSFFFNLVILLLITIVFILIYIDYCQLDFIFNWIPNGLILLIFLIKFGSHFFNCYFFIWIIFLIDLIFQLHP